MWGTSVSQVLTVLSIVVTAGGVVVAGIGIARVGVLDLHPRSDRVGRLLILLGATIMFVGPALQFIATVWRAFE